MKSLTHRERLEICLSDNTLPDRLPVAFWRHFPVDDQNPYTLARATINFQNTFDFDFIKVSPSSSFCLKDWGVEDKWNGNPEGTRDYLNPVIQNPQDWLKIKPLNPKNGHIGQQLKCLELLKKEYKSQTPIIQTIFNPLSQAKNLVGKDNIVKHIRLYPEKLKAALNVIVKSTIEFIIEAKKIGVDGIFYAVQHASADILSLDEYRQFEKHYDLLVLDVVKDLWLNVLHIHGQNIYFEEFLDYPSIAVINWHDRNTPPSLREAKKVFEGVLCGGLDRINTMVLGNQKNIEEEIKDARNATGDNKFILGTGCVLPIVTPFGNISSVRKIIQK